MNTRSVTITSHPPIAFGLGQWSTDERTVTFRPESPLSPGTQYSITVTGKDRAGNTMRSFSWSFSAGPAGVRAGSGEARIRDKVEARGDERLFTLFAALNATGHDEGITESGPVRASVREKLGDLPLKAVEPMRQFRAGHPQPLSAYVSYVLSLGPPPKFAEQRAANGLESLNRVLAEFYAAARISELWKAQNEAYAKAAAAFASEGPTGLGRVMDYMRVADLPAARIVLLPNLLDAPGRDYLVRQADAATMVIGSPGPLGRVAMTRLTARLLLAAARPDINAELQRTSPLYDLVKESAQRHGYNDWAEVVRESLVVAVTAQLALPAEQRERFLKEHYAKGLILAEHFASALAKYEQETISLIEFFPQMLRAVNLDEERRKFAERKP
jgi:hypothetical protein